MAANRLVWELVKYVYNLFYESLLALVAGGSGALFAEEEVPWYDK